MKILKIIVTTTIVLLILIFVSVSVYMHFYGKEIIESTLSGSLERDVTIGKITYQFPVILKATNVAVGPKTLKGSHFEANSIVAHMSMDALLKRQYAFDTVTITKPNVVVEGNDGQEIPEEAQRRHGVVVPNSDGQVSSVKLLPAESIDEGSSAEISIKQLFVKRGTIQYRNKSIDKDFSITLEDVFIRCGQVVFPLKPVQTDFKVTGRLVKEGNPLSGSSVKAAGWVDIVKRDMQADIEVVEADGTIGMAARAVSTDNDMHVSGDVKFENILMGAKKDSPTGASPVNELISSALSSAGVEIGAKFSFDTKMDNFRPEKVSFSGNVVTK